MIDERREMMVEREEEMKDFIKFLGTAGARFVMIKQLRASGGLWVSYHGVNILIDPGPGSLLKCLSSKPKLDPMKLDAIIITHRHLDHCNDINVMIEAMTEGGFKRKGVVFCPADALGEDSIISRHALGFPEKIQVLEERKAYSIGEFKFETSMRHKHPNQTYGLKFSGDDFSASLIADTKYFPELVSFYNTDLVIIPVVFFTPRPEVEHLCLDDAKILIQQIKPKKALLTHFGMTMLAAKPHMQAKRLTEELGVEVQAAYDGMTLAL